jgi:7 transmembrane receptor (rhodopsin family)
MMKTSSLLETTATSIMMGGEQQQQEGLFFPWNSTNNDTSLLFDPPQMRNLTSLNLMEQIGHLLNFYYTPFLVTVGSVGNILSVLVFFKTKLRKLSSSYYLAALGISDTCFLFVMFISWLSFFGINVYSRNFFCQFFTYFSSVCCFLSVWFVVAFTVERFIAVLYPLQRQTMCTVRRAKMVICGLIGLSLVFCTPFYLFSEPYHVEQANATICDVRMEYKVSCLRFDQFMCDVILINSRFCEYFPGPIKIAAFKSLQTF